MKAAPPIVTFYSFKGGAGRTTLMANAAAALAHPEASSLPFAAKKILLWDLDIEAPGLHLLPGLRRDPLPENGFIEWLGELPTDGSEISAATLRSVKKLVHTAPQFANIGILPAFGKDYPAAMYSNNWAYWFHDNAEHGATLLRNIAEQFGEYDYIFIDSRTGISDIGGVLTGILPHITVLVGQYTRQSTRGLTQAWGALRQVQGNPKVNELRHPLPNLELMLAASPVPAGDESLRIEARKVWQESFGSELTDASRIEIPFEGKLLYAEKLYAADPAEQGELAQAYRTFAQRLQDHLTRQAAPTPTKSASTPPKVSTTAQGKTFEREMAELLRSLGYEVETEQLIGPNRVDLLARRSIGLTDDIFLVECMDYANAVDKDTVEKLALWLNTDDARRLNARGMLIARSGFSPAALAAAKQYNILAFSPAELERRIFDFAPYLRELCRQWEESDISRYYIEQQLQRDGDATGLLNAAHAWAEGKGERLWVVLGDFGAGKSTFVRRIGYDLARRKLDNMDDLDIPVPIVIDLREHPNLTALEDLVAAHFAKFARHERPPVRAILRMVERGRALLLLDSFDEMGAAAAGRAVEDQFRMLAGITQVARAPETRSIEELAEMRELAAMGEAIDKPGTRIEAHSKPLSPEDAARLKAKLTESRQPDADLPPRARRVLITCRTEFFRSHDEARHAGNLRDSLLGQVARELVASIEEIATFTPEQVQDYLKARLGKESQKASRFIRGDEHMLALAERPVMLEMLVSEYPRLHKQGGKVNAASLYASFTQDWLEHWAARQKTTLVTSAEQRRLLLEALACKQWREYGDTIHYDDLLAWVKQRIKDDAELKKLDPVRVDMELRTAAFLVRSPDGFYRFSHKSFREFFLARHLLRQAKNGTDALTEALDLPPLTAPVERFVRELLELPDSQPLRKSLAEGLRTILTSAYRNQTSENALHLATLGRDENGVIDTNMMRELLQGQAPQLAGAQLAGLDLRGAWLENAQLAVADLEDSLLDGTNLSHANLGASRLARASLDGANLQHATLEFADLAEASLANANLGKAQLSYATLRFAKLMQADLKGAEIEGVKFDHARLAGAKLRGLHFDEPQLRLATGPGATPKKKALEWPRGKPASPLLDTGHTAMISGVSYSPDGHTLATAAFDRTARLWDVATQRELLRLEGHDAMLSAIAYSPDGSKVATASFDGLARLWDATTGRELLRIETHFNHASAIAFSPDGRAVATTSHDKTVCLREVESGRELHRTQAHDGNINAFAFSSDGSLLATASSDKSARIWEANTGRELRRLKGHDGSIMGIAFSPDGRLVATASQDTTVRLWDASDGRELRKLEHEHFVTNLAFSPDGSLLATACMDSQIRIWESQTGRILHTIRISSPNFFQTITFSPDGATLAIASRQQILFADISIGNIQGILSWQGNDIYGIAFLPDGNTFVTLGGDNTARFWDTVTGRQHANLEDRDSPLLKIAVSPDGRRFASATIDGVILIRDTANNRELRRLEGHKDWVRRIVFSPDGTMLASASSDQTIRLWETATGREHHRLEAQQDWTNQLAFSPDGRILATASEVGESGNTVQLWNVSTGQAGLNLSNPEGWIRCLTFAPNGDIFATSSFDDTYFWSIQTGRKLRKLEGGMCAAFSPDGRIVATANYGGVVMLWETKTWRELRRLEGHTGSVNAIAFSPDASLIVTASDDKTARIWETNNGRLLATLFPSRKGWMCWRHDEGGFYADEGGLETFHLVAPGEPQRRWHPADLRKLFDLDLRG